MKLFKSVYELMKSLIMDTYYLNPQPSTKAFYVHILIKLALTFTFIYMYL